MKTPQSLSRFWGDPILILGLSISISMGLIMVLTGNDTIISLIVGLLSTIVTLLADIIARIQKTETTILEANSLQNIFLDERLGNSLRELAHSYDAVKSYEFEHYIKLADAHIAECKTYVRQLASGSIFSPSKSIYEYSVYTALDKATDCIRAVDCGPMTFWETERGRKYMEANRIAVSRGIKIIRLFALTSKDARKYSEILNSHHAAGIHVIIVTPSRIENEFLIIDSNVRIDIKLDQDGKHLGEQIIVESAQISEAIEKFELAASFGKSLEDLNLHPA